MSLKNKVSLPFLLFQGKYLAVLWCSISLITETLAKKSSLHFLLSLKIAAYCVVATESAGRQVPIAFLERIKDDFVSKYGGGKASTAPANSLNKEFGYLIKVLAVIGV